MFLTAVTLLALAICLALAFFGYVALSFTVLVILAVHWHKELGMFIQCLPREINFLACMSKALWTQKKHENKTLSEVLSIQVKKHPNKTAIIEAESGRCVTFKEFAQLSNKVSNAFKALQKGDNVALIMNNRIEFLPIYIGLSNYGITTAFINTNLRGDSLNHALSVIEFKAIICESNLLPILDDYRILNKETDTEMPTLYTIGGDTGDPLVIRLENLLDESSIEPPNIDDDETIDCNFPVAYIFTSGTSGHPKPAVMARKKFLAGFLIFRYLTGIQSDDIVYSTLPMYHTSGSIIFASGTILCGCTLVIRGKFSASHYITDCIKYNVTYAGYIGEMMRYLLLLPPSPNDKKHGIKKIVGNGLRKSMFSKLKSRFNFEQVYEFYGATEANFGFINCDNTDGAVGFLFKCFPFLNFRCLVKIDCVTGELVRDDNGRAIECQPGEEGTLIAIINKQQPYYGYIDKTDSDRKIAHDVYTKGDKYFMSGDLLTVDEYGYLYFVDRLGDTFRWKGENVSTIEVENIISSSYASYIHCVVYGVTVPECEGKAGMMYIQSDYNDIDLDKINGSLDTWRQHLPEYAIPIFVRIGEKLNVTSTFKYQKVALKNEAFNLEYCTGDNDQIFVLHNGVYVKMDSNVFRKITNSCFKF